MDRKLIGKPVVTGKAVGTALVSNEPLSFWGGLDPNTGEIIDRRHELSGSNAAGKIFVFPQGRGSSTSSGTLLESIRSGVAPAAIINLRTDPILALGAIIADELYQQTMPIVVLSEGDFYSIKEGDHLIIEPNGSVKVRTRN